MSEIRTVANDVDRHRSAVALARLLPRSWLTGIRLGAFAVSGLAGSGVAASLLLDRPDFTAPLLGISLIGAGIWLEQLLLYAFHNSRYFYGMTGIIDSSSEPAPGVTYDVAEVVLRNEADVTQNFLKSQLGRTVLIRCGIMPDTIAHFLTTERPRISTMMIPVPDGEIFTLIGLGRYLLLHDTAFATLLKEHGVTNETYVGALRWVIGAHHQMKRAERWWSRDQLSRTSGIGSELSYGNTYLLERYTRNIATSAVFSILTNDNPLAEEYVTTIEQALSRDKAANVLISGEPGVGKMDLVMAVERRAKEGSGLNAVRGKRFLVLDLDRLFAVHAEKQELELTLYQLLDEAAAAGNVILVLENIAQAVREAEAIGVFLPELLDSYLATPQLQIIATTTPGELHQYLEPLGAFTRRFAPVAIETADRSATTRVLQTLVPGAEAKHGIIFTYDALSAVTTAADRYIVEGVMPDKAISLLLDIASRCAGSGNPMITADRVYHLVSETTGIPTGPITSEAERDQLLHLEDRLKERVIGQSRALVAVARTMRRARAGIQEAEKPMGSFLFLGPTGVGKTETAKALAAIFFGGEDTLQRFDMSEYSGPDAVARLLGDETGSGALADRLREHPYCVLLLDEFEKASQGVHDLFLQILDEGQFTDARGTRVNARNTIIIATSNAGSDLIMRTVAQRQTLEHLDREIIDHIVKQGIYRPELINRFDSTVIFEPLTREEQSDVASLLLKSLATRIKERGYDLSVNRDLLDVLVAKGYDPEYGARPMQRVLQDLIEEKVAERIIAGTVKKGDTITLKKADFTPEELALV